MSLWQHFITPPRPRPFSSVSAQHNITIKRSWPWLLRWLFALCVLLVVAGGSWWAARYTIPLPPPHLSLMMPRNALGGQDSLNEELTELRTLNASLESELAMREGAHTTLTQHTEVIEQENAQLKEELAYLQKLVADATSEAGVRIQDVRLEPQPNNRYRYRILLVQGGNPKDDFEGEVKLLPATGDFKPDGSPRMVPLEAASDKDNADPAAPLPVKFKYYQRLDGIFRVPDTQKINQFTVQVFKKGVSTPAIARSINVK